MKIHQKKIEILSLAISLAIFFIFVQTATAQQLKPTEIIYSRLPTDLSQSPTSANSPTIWAVGQDGANDRQIAVGMEPRISDDGRYLLFRRIVAAAGDVFHYNPYASQAQGNLWVRDLANNSETMIFDFSTNGRRLLGYFFSPFSNQGNYQIILDYGTLFYKMNLDGTDSTPLDPYFGGGIPRENDTFPVLRRGDSLLAGNNRDRSTYGLMTRTLGSEVPLDTPNTDGSDYNPSWSNDNQLLGLTTIGANRNFIYGAVYYPYFFTKISKIKPDGTGRTLLLDLNANDQSPNGFAFGTVWTEDNSKIITAARIGGIASLYAVNTDGSRVYTRIPLAAGNAPDFVGGIVQTRQDQSLISNGGGIITDAPLNFSPSNNVTDAGQFSMTTAIGEPIILKASGGSFSINGGFLADAPFAPTAASVALGGRVLSADGSGIRNAIVTLTDGNGQTRGTLTGKFGGFNFNDVTPGATYILRVSARRFTFSQNTRIVSPVESATDINFTADNSGVLQGFE